MLVMSEAPLTPDTTQEAARSSLRARVLGLAAAGILLGGGVVAYDQLTQNAGKSELRQVEVTTTPTAEPTSTPTPDTFPTGPAPVGGVVDNMLPPTPGATLVTPK